jgi:predicted nucleic acid-binding Zn ribbon protein
MVSLLDLSALQRTFCSDRCKEAYHQLRKEKRAEERKKVCEACGEEFIARRQDEKTCSDGCRQKAYRRRNKESQRHP